MFALGSSICLLAKAVPHISQVLGTQACFSLLLSWLMPSFWLTFLFCYPSISPSPDSPEPSSCHVYPSIFSCLIWFQPGLILIPAATSQSFLMLGLASSHDLFALYISTVLSPLSFWVLGVFLGHIYLDVFVWRLWFLTSTLTSVNCLGFLHELLPWSHHLFCSTEKKIPPKAAKTSYTKHETCWMLPCSLLPLKHIFHMRKGRHN